LTVFLAPAIIQAEEMPIMNEENIQKGMQAEKDFELYLNTNKIPFYRIDQEKESRSGELRDKDISRPDYIVHTKNGIFYIDVKYRKFQDFGRDNEKRFYLTQDEIKFLFKFQEELRQPIWIAFTNDSDHAIFHYSPISQIHEYHAQIAKVFKQKDYKNFDELRIRIPNPFLLYDHLSFEKGLYKKTSPEFIEIEAEEHARIVQNLKKNVSN
jgi:Holliday junction resolvase